MRDAGNSRDLLVDRRTAAALFWVPILAVIAGGAFVHGTPWRTAIWACALTTMGIACSANALRCGRVHCYLTGPFFLIMALLVALYGVGIAPLGARGWNIIAFAILIGAVVLCCAPEYFFGKYRRR